MNTNNSATNNDENSGAAQIEHLLGANRQLQEQLASLSVLYASLTRQPSDPLVSYGEQANRRILNARSIRSLYLREETRLSPHRRTGLRPSVFARSRKL